MKLFLFTLLISMVAFTACSETPEEAKTEKTEEIVVEDVPVYVKPEGEPDRVVVQHILIAFKGKVPRAKRSREEAQELALNTGRIPALLEGKQIRKVIVVPQKLINIVAS